jgi:Uma2 family endonuclease
MTHDEFMEAAPEDRKAELIEGVMISDTETYEPDILFVRSDRSHLITQKKLEAAPDLVVEILSASTARYDRGVKRRNYEQAGVREMWLIDPYGPAGTQFFQRRQGALMEVAPSNGVIHSLVLPGFELRVEWLWLNEEGELPDPLQVLKALGVI